MARRVFVDAPDEHRCIYPRELSDGTHARCGRWRKVGDYCRQHAKIVERDGEPANPYKAR